MSTGCAGGWWGQHLLEALKNHGDVALVTGHGSGGLVVGLGGPFQPSRFYEWAWVVLAQVPEMIPGKTGPHLGIAH